MKYLLFSGENYYASGGVDDLVGEFSFIEHAQAYLFWVTKPDEDIWAHIVKKDTMQKVSNFWQGYDQYYHVWGKHSDRERRGDYFEALKRFGEVLYSSRMVNGKYEYVGTADYKKDRGLSQECLKQAEKNGERVLR